MMNQGLNLHLTLSHDDKVIYSEKEVDELKIDHEMKQSINNIIRKLIGDYKSISSISINNTEGNLNIKVVTTDGAQTLITNPEILSIAKRILQSAPFVSEKKVEVSLQQSKVPPLLPSRLTGLGRLDNRLLAHIHGDEFGKNSELEGMSGIAALEYFYEFLSNLPKDELAGYGLGDKSLEALKQGIAIDESLMYYGLQKAQEILKDNLDKNQEILISSGWTSQPLGHKMYLQLLPTSNGTVTMRIYNLGAGGSEYHYTTEAGVKKKSIPIIEWRGIDPLKFTQTSFLETVNDLQTRLKVPSDTRYEKVTPANYGPKDIYLGLKAILEPKEEVLLPSDKCNQLLMTPQRAGFCGWKGLTQYKSGDMTDKDRKRLKCHIRIQSLLDFIDANKALKNDQIEEWRLAYKSFQKLSRSIDKLYKQKVIDENYVVHAKQMLEPVSVWLKENKPILSNSKTFEIQNQPTTSFAYTLATSPSLFDQTDKVINQQLCSYPVSQMQKLPFDNPEKIHESLKELIRIGEESWKQKDDIGSFTALDMAIRKLPKDEDFWKKASHDDPEVSKALVVQLGKLQQLYFQACVTMPDAQMQFLPRNINTMRLVYIQNQLAKSISPSNWNEVKPTTGTVKGNDKEYDIPFFPESDYLDYSNRHNFDAHLDEEMKELSSWLTAKTTIPLNPFMTEVRRYDNEMPYVIKNQFSFSQSSDYHTKKNIVDIFCTLDPTLRTRMQEAYPEFAKMPKWNQDALIYKSDMLPEWVKSIRDSFLYSFYLRNELLTYDNIDRSEGISTKLHILYTEPNCTTLKFYSDTLHPTPAQERIKEPKYYPQFEQMSEEVAHLAYLDPRGAKHLIQSSLLGYRWSETNIASRKSLASPMEVEVVKNLAYCNIDPLTSLTSAFEFFTKEPNKFKNPDFQIQFERLLFCTGTLNDNLKLVGLKEQLVEFLETHLKKNIDENQIPSIAFLLRMMRYCSNYFKDPTFERAIPRLREMLLVHGIDNNHKSLLYSELASSLSQKKELDEKDVEELLSAIIWINKFHPSREFTNAYINETLQGILPKRAEEVLKHLVKNDQPNQALLNRIFANISSHAVPYVWSLQVDAGAFPSFSSQNKKCELYPLAGEMSIPGFSCDLPLTLVNNTHMKKLYPEIKAGTQHENNIMSFNDQFGQPTRVQTVKNKVSIQNKRNGTVYHFVPPEELKGHDKLLLSSRSLTDNYTHWISSDGNIQKMAIVDPKTNQILYEGNFDKGKLSSITRLNDGLKLGGSPAQMTLDKTEYIHGWYKDDHLEEIELPRYSITFKSDKGTPPKFYSNQFPGYFLRPGERIKSLGTYHHYLVVENEKGQKKVLMPQQHFIKKSDKPYETFLPRYSINLDSGNPIQNLHVYDVAGNKRLISKSRLANLYLAETLVLVHEYKYAAKLLNEFGPKLTPYTKEEKSILEKIASIDEVTGTIEGNSAALQTFAYYLLMKNAGDFPSREDKTNYQEAARKHYETYLQHYNNATAFKLSAEEEIYLLNTFDTKENTPILGFRLKELTSKPMPQITSTYSFEALIAKPETSEKPEINFLRDFNYHWNLKIIGYQKVSIFHYPISRMLVQDGMNYLRAYEIAKKGTTEEKYRLKQAIIFSKATGTLSFIDRFILEEVLKSPNDFPDLITFYHSEEDKKEWTGKINRILQEKYDKYVPEPAEKKTQQIEQIKINPEDYKLSKNPPKLDLKIPLQIVPISKTLPQSIEKDRKIFAPKNWKASLSTSQSNIADITPNALSISGTIPSSEKPASSVAEFFKSIQISEKLVNKEVQRLQDDHTEYSKQERPQQYALDLAELPKVSESLSSLQKGNDAIIKKLQSDIIKIARKEPATPFEKARTTFQNWGQTFHPLKMEELIVNFAKQDPAALIQRNPSLKPDDIQEIYKKIGEYLLYYTQNQQAGRCLEAISKINESSNNADDIADLTQELAAQFYANRCYNPVKFPAYLAFEYFADIQLREKQVSMLDEFLSGKNNNLIMELIMGSGKSKVLLPLLGLLRANGKNLSMVMVPEPLYGSVSSDTQEILRKAFGQTLHTLYFDRNTSFTKTRLENILNELQSVQENKECLIMTSKSVACIVVKFIERAIQEYSQAEASKEISPEFKLMREIILLLSSNGFPLLDEVDHMLSALREVSFSVGDAKEPIPLETSLITNIFETIYKDDEIKKLVRIESDPSADKKIPALTKDNYESIKPALAKAILKNFSKVNLDDEQLQAKVRNYFINLSENKEKMILKYILRDKDHLEEAQIFYDSQPQEIKEVLALAGEQICNYLPHTLMKNCDENYGIDELMQGILSIPFSSANTPTRGSQFATAHITMNYTIQAYMKKNIPHRVIVDEIHRLEQKALQEIEESKGKKHLTDTHAWKTFCHLKGDLNIPLINLTDKQIDLLHAKINSDASLKLELIQRLILPQMQIFKEKMSFNAINLVSLFSTISGFTGTLWNSSSMHRHLSTMPAKGTDALTIEQLWNKSFNSLNIVENGSPEFLMDHLIKKGFPFDLVCDAGGYFKDNTNLQNAMLMHQKLKKPVVFYDTNGQQSIWDGVRVTSLAESKIKEDERLTFLDQAHTTGADVKQKRKAVGVVTISDKITLRDLLQSVWRLRGLEKAQKVEFLMTNDTESILRQTLKTPKDKPIDFSDILLFSIINQARQQGNDAYKAFLQELEDIPQKHLLEVLTNSKSTNEEISIAIKKMSECWVKPTSAPASELYGQLVTEKDSKDVKETKVALSKEALKKFGITNDGYLKEIDAISKRYENALPEKISIKAGNVDLAMDVQQQKIVEVQTQVETLEEDTSKEIANGEMKETEDLSREEVATFDDSIFSKWITPTSSSYGDPPSDRPPMAIPYIPFKLYMEQHPVLKDLDLASAFEGIDLSLNMFQWPDANPKASDLRLFGAHRKTIHYVEIRGDKISILNSKQAGNRLRKNRTNVYNLTTGYCNSKETIKDKALLEKLVKIKFLSGESVYNEQEMAILKDWIKANNPQKMHVLFQKYILSEKVHSQQKYKHSALEKLFNDLCA